MRHFRVLLRPLHVDRRGATALECALVAGALATVLVAGFTVLGTDIATVLAAAPAAIPGG